jgi:hypothetical protein
MRLICISVVSFALVWFLNSPARSEVVLFSQDFESNSTANWTVNDPGLSDVTVDFFYDYSQIGVPTAPGSGTSRGLKLTANNTRGVFSGFSVSPTGQNFTGSYRLEFNLWQNYVGPLATGGSGTTQLSTYGIGTSGNVSIWPASSPKESLFFAHTLDGGSATDYRVYSSAAPTSYPAGSAVYVATGTGNINSSNAYYAALGGQAAPASQIALYPGQTGTTAAGVTGFAWRNILIDVNADTQTARWSIDGLLISELSLTGLTLGGGNIFFGHSDTNAGVSTDPNASLLNVTLIDNIRVTAVPEPTTLGLGLICIGAIAMRRRRR